MQRNIGRRVLSEHGLISNILCGAIRSKPFFILNSLAINFSPLKNRLRLSMAESNLRMSLTLNVVLSELPPFAHMLATPISSTITRVDLVRDAHNPHTAHIHPVQSKLIVCSALMCCSLNFQLERNSIGYPGHSLKY